MIELLLPYPPSANRNWRSARGRQVLSPESKAFKATVMYISKIERVKCTLKPVCVEIELHPKTKKNGGASKTVLDLDNCMKATLDALQGVAYENDRQIQEIHLKYGEPIAMGGVSIKIKEI